MTFRATQRPNWAGGILCLVIAGLCFLFGVYNLLPHEWETPLLVTLLPLAIAVLGLGIAGAQLYDSLRPKVLTADGEYIRLLRGQKVLGQVSFANVELLAIDWVKPKVQGGLVGLAAHKALNPNAKPRAVAAGVRIRLRDSAAGSNWWPGKWFNRRSREVRIGWRMDCSFERLAQELRARAAPYRKEQGPPPTDEGGNNPPSFR
jgi:hypothetical protein